MKACVYAAPGKVELREVPMPPLKDEQIRIKVAYCAICATDAHVVNDGLFGTPEGSILGHEVSGVVCELGPNTEASGLKVGDRVVGSPIRNCGCCDQCRKGNPQYCTTYADIVFEGMAEYKVYSQKNLYKIPDTLSLRKAALVEPLTCVMRGMDLAAIKQGQTVCISGAGGVGLLMLQAVRYKGAAKITVIEPVAEKRKLALRLGADYVIDPFSDDILECSAKITNGMGYDVVIEVSGVPATTQTCLDILGKCGTVVYFAVYPVDYEMPLNLFKLYQKEARIQTVYTHPLIFPRSVEFANAIDLDSVIGAEFPLEQCAEAFAAFALKKYPKVLICCE